MTSAIVKNRHNSVLQDALHSSLQGTTMKSRTFLHVATDHSTIKAGSGTHHHGVPGHERQILPESNAQATLAEATFWIETIHAAPKGQPDQAPAASTRSW